MRLNRKPSSRVPGLSEPESEGRAGAMGWISVPVWSEAVVFWAASVDAGLSSSVPEPAANSRYLMNA